MSDHADRPRRRPLHTVLLILAGLLALPLILYAILAGIYFAGTTNVDTNYADIVNERARAVPESERAWPEHTDVYARMPPGPDADTDLLDEPADHPGMLEMRGYLESVSPRLAEIRRIAQRPHLGHIARPGADPHLLAAMNERDGGGRTPDTAPENPFILDLKLGHLGVMRRLALLLACDARLARLDADPERWHADVTALVGIAGQLTETPLTIERLVAYAIAAGAMEEIRLALSSPLASRLSADQLADLQSRLRAHADRPIDIDLRGARLIVHDLAQRLFTDDANGDGRLSPDGMDFLVRTTGHEPAPRWRRPLEPLKLVSSASRREFLAAADAAYDRLEELAARPFWTGSFERIEGYIDMQDRIDHDDPIDLLDVYTPPVTKAYLSQEANRQHLDATLAAIAIERFQRAEGRPPDSLDELVPDYLAEPPIDRFTGEPLRYTIKNARPYLYSTGSDLDDDGARAPDDWPRDKADAWIGRSTMRLHEPPDGDWIFLPALDADGRPFPPPTHPDGP